ncbi:hypothetical protein PIROE2DRAFT_14203 [Piromyces sp. E2]|nr:hypothetical protein PIROE2DRAFT_14203 [Piromyces sp. E2]|eukprot:OUM60114.1 hypothetical protein PIROE2DRAFT_14203 [Piromyces sp. E2]
MILKKIIKSILLLLQINYSFEIAVGGNSIFYDKENNHFPLKVGDEFVFKSYTQIKNSVKPACIDLFKGNLYDSGNIEVSDIDYYFQARDTVVAIIPDLPKSELNKEFFIAIQLENNLNSQRFLYSKRFQIVGGGSPRKMATGSDACNVPRNSIYNSRNIPVISNGISVNKKMNYSNSNSKNNSSNNLNNSKNNSNSKENTSSKTTSSPSGNNKTSN